MIAALRAEMLISYRLSDRTSLSGRGVDRSRISGDRSDRSPRNAGRYIDSGRRSIPML